ARAADLARRTRYGARRPALPLRSPPPRRRAPPRASRARAGTRRMIPMRAIVALRRLGRASAMTQHAPRVPPRVGSALRLTQPTLVAPRVSHARRHPRAFEAARVLQTQRHPREGGDPVHRATWVRAL